MGIESMTRHRPEMKPPDIPKATVIQVEKHDNGQEREEHHQHRSVSKNQPEGILQDGHHLLIPHRTHLNFQLHEKSGDYYIEVINNKTNKVIREIPPKDVLDMYVAMAELFGLIVDEKI